MDSTIFSSFGIDLTSISNMSTSINSAVTTVVNKVITAETDMVNSADLYGFYEHITDGSVGSFS